MAIDIFCNSLGRAVFVFCFVFIFLNKLLAFEVGVTLSFHCIAHVNVCMLHGMCKISSIRHSLHQDVIKRKRKKKVQPGESAQSNTDQFLSNYHGECTSENQVMCLSRASGTFLSLNAPRHLQCSACKHLINIAWPAHKQY